MKTVHYFIIIALSLLWVAYAKAQTVNPDSMLNNDNPIQVPEAPVIPDSTPNLSKEWVQLNRGVLCNSMGMVREMLKTMRGQTTWAAAGNAMSIGDPFNAIVIVRNPETHSYSVVLMRTESNIACIIATGVGLELLDNQN